MEETDDNEMQKLLSKLGLLGKTPEETLAFLVNQALRFFNLRLKETRVEKQEDGKQAKQTKSRYRDAFCSFCRKNYKDVGPLVEGPGDVYICGECIELCGSIMEQEIQRRNSVSERMKALQFSNYPIGLAADSFTFRRDDLYD
jgi:hypothetical protein